MAVFPRQFDGGMTLEGIDLCTFLRAVGAADLSVARIVEGHFNALALVRRYGSASQLEALAQSVARGALSAVWGADDAQGLQLESQNSAKSLRGQKIHASGAGFVTRPIVTAMFEEGQVMCLLELTPEYPHDLSAWQVLGMRATATGSVALTGQQITANEIIGSPGDFMRQPYFSGGAWRFCAAHVGATERLVDLFRTHLLATRRGDDPYQLQRLAHCVASARTARFWVEEAARRLADDCDPEGVVAFANLTRMVTERSALDVMEHVQRGVGLRAFVRPHDIERISRDLATYLRQPVPDQAMSDAARYALASAHPIGEMQ